ncbi:hypothetical protein [Paenibacillus alkalitolerans]|uniref:hypothetical protein n=1 Tax=Paenibacillus alkalitolerans TaxID=2799335 RepID=UPI0018F482EF|nr:hypothetical protein [Paenibacillus alkalitolerans]
MKPKIWFEDNLLRFNPEYSIEVYDPKGLETPNITQPSDCVDLQIGNIEKYEQHGYTLYVKGTERNVIVVEIGKLNMRVLHEYSHLIPTWMKEDFNRFLSA